MQIFNAKTQQLEDVQFFTDKNREIIATFSDGHFLKFPAGIDQAEAMRLIQAHQEANEGQEIITPEQEVAMQAELRASEDLVATLNGTSMLEGTKTNDTPSTEGTYNSSSDLAI